MTVRKFGTIIICILIFEILSWFSYLHPIFRINIENTESPSSLPLRSDYPEASCDFVFLIYTRIWWKVIWTSLSCQSQRHLTKSLVASGVENLNKNFFSFFINIWNTSGIRQQISLAWSAIFFRCGLKAKKKKGQPSL